MQVLLLEKPMDTRDEFHVTKPEQLVRGGKFWVHDTMSSSVGPVAMYWMEVLTGEIINDTDMCLLSGKGIWILENGEEPAILRDLWHFGLAPMKNPDGYNPRSFVSTKKYGA